MKQILSFYAGIDPLVKHITAIIIFSAIARIISINDHYKQAIKDDRDALRNDADGTGH